MKPISGPLSVNLATLPRAGHLDVRPNQKAWVSQSAIRLLSGEHISLRGATTWQPGPAPLARSGRAARLRALREVATCIDENIADQGLVPVLDHILGLPAQPSAWQQPFLIAWESFRAQPKAGLLSAGKELEAVLGLGRGLTPSGDDFVCGFLLGLNRLAPAEQPPQTLELGVSLAQAARRRTTALSVALIEAAGLGSADQRLVSAWDGLLSASLSPAQIYHNLSAYGSSSGIDALAGFAAAASLIND